MARAHGRRIILPDALCSSSRRPGPGARRLESYQELAAALRDKELLSEWILGNERSELQLREALTRTLSEHASFGYIRAGSKLPQGYPKPGKGKYSIATESGSTELIRPNGTDWVGASAAPREGNWSVIPRENSRLLVFDLDVRKHRILEDGTKLRSSAEERYLEARRSIELLSGLLGVDLRMSYAQLSPSGGVHIFVLLPEGVDPKELPSAKLSDGMRALAGVPRERWAHELRGDIRSGASNGFILMAGSELSGEAEDGAPRHYRPLAADPRWSDFKDYRSGRKLRLLELPPSAVDRLREARALDLELKGFSEQRAAASPPVEVTELDLETQPARGPLKELRSESYGRLLQRLQQNPPASFHAARAQIYRALSCCGSPESIASICRSAGYGRDSHGNRELTDDELLSDMESMARRGLTAPRCGSHCGASAPAGSDGGARSQEVQALSISILSAKLAGSSQPLGIARRRLEESALLEARAKLDQRAQRAGDYGVYGKRNPLGLNYRELTRELIGGESFRRLLRGERSSVAGYRLRALELAVGYFGPLFAAGAPVAIAPAAELMELFGWSRSQLREALRLLRSSEVFSLERRQSSGRASGYGPGAKRFYDDLLSKRLKSTWGGSMVENSAGERAFLGGFFDYGRGRIVRPDGSSYSDGYLREIGGGFLGLLQELSIDLPRARTVGSSVVARYLRKSLERYLRIGAELEQAAETIRELLTPDQSGLRPLERESFLLDSSSMSAEAYGKDRAIGNSHSFGLRGSIHRKLGDRSPPADEEDPPSPTKSELEKKEDHRCYPRD